MLANAPHGEISARIDCNRGSGTWSANDSGQLQFGDLASTRAMCPANSLYDLIVSQWTRVRFYALREGHLFLTLPGYGVYEFEPLPATTGPATPTTPPAPASHFKGPVRAPDRISPVRTLAYSRCRGAGRQIH